MNRPSRPRHGKTILCFINRGKLISGMQHSSSNGINFITVLLNYVFPPDKSLYSQLEVWPPFLTTYNVFFVLSEPSPKAISRILSLLSPFVPCSVWVKWFMSAAFYETSRNPENQTVLHSLCITLCRQNHCILLALQHAYRTLGEYKPSVQTQTSDRPAWWATSRTCAKKSPGLLKWLCTKYKPHKPMHTNAGSCRTCRTGRDTTEIAHSIPTRDNWRTSCHVNEW